MRRNEILLELKKRYQFILFFLFVILCLFSNSDRAFASTKTMESGKLYNGSISKEGEVDYFKFYSKKGGEYCLCINNKNIKSKFDNEINKLYYEGYVNNAFTVVALDKSKKLREAWHGNGIICSPIFVEYGGKQVIYVHLKKGTTYFRLNANGNTGKYSIGITRVPKTPSNITVTKYGAKSKKIKWKKVNDCSGYYVYRAESGTWDYKKVATIKNSNRVYYVDSKVASGKKYDYRVMSYKSFYGFICIGGGFSW